MAIINNAVEFYNTSNNKMLSYRRATALQGTLVLAESGRLELKRQYFTDIVSLASTTVT